MLNQSQQHRSFWLRSLALCCAIVIIWSFALLTGPARAQSLSSSGSVFSSPERQVMLSELGMNSPFSARGQERSHSNLPAAASAGNKASAQQQITECSGWNPVTSPNPSPDYDQLYGTSAASPKDIWAVGQYCASGCGTEDEVDRALIEHWNGSAWSVMPSPDIDSAYTFLSAVDAISPKDVWAVGDYDNGTHIQTLTEHWDGSAWSIVPSPNPGNANNYLNGVAASSSRDVWAVGTDHVDLQEGPSLETLILHWNGSAWSAVSSPNPDPGSARNEFTGVSVVNRNDAWAVGWSCTSYSDCFNGVITPKTMTEHWNGTQWSIVSSPNPTNPNNNELTSVSARAANDVWAVGFACRAAGCDEADALVEHWDGRAWSVVPSPLPGLPNAVYWGVLAITPNDAWAVGSASGDGNNTFISLVSHWDGTSWSQVNVLSQGAFDNDLRSLAAIGTNNVWVVGDLDNGSGEQTQIEHFSGPCN